MIVQFLPVVAVLVTLLICLRARPIGEAFGVMAIPDGRRKLHSRSTPQLGGVAILCGFGVWLAGNLVTGADDQAMLLTILLAAGGLGLVGFIDDRHEIPPASRILLLLVFTGIAFTLHPQLMIPVLHWYSFGDVVLPVWVYLVLMAVTAVGLVNSVNMADGQNGLVGSMFAAWSFCIAMVSSGVLATAGGVLCALALVFLVFNWQGKIFLGDCGSYGLTFAFGIMVTLAHARGDISLEVIVIWFFIPVLDCLRLMITRPLSGRSLFEGSRDHFHHRLIDSMGNELSALVYGGAVALSSLAATLAPHFSLVILCLMCSFYFSFARLSEAGRAEAPAPLPEDENVVVLRDGKRRS